MFLLTERIRGCPVPRRRARAGPDAVSNMQWQTLAKAKVKDLGTQGLPLVQNLTLGTLGRLGVDSRP
jgi:hypothetical protein